MPLAIIYAENEEAMAQAIKTVKQIPTVDLCVTKTQAAAFLCVAEPYILRARSRNEITPCDESLANLTLYKMADVVDYSERMKRRKY